MTAYCSKLGLEPSQLDAIMLSPGPEERMRFKQLEHIHVNQLRARFAIVKYINQLVTPLLSYVDIRLISQEPTNTTEGGEGEVQARSVTHNQMLNCSIDVDEVVAHISKLFVICINSFFRVVPSVCHTDSIIIRCAT